MSKRTEELITRAAKGGYRDAALLALASAVSDLANAHEKLAGAQLANAHRSHPIPGSRI